MSYAYAGDEARGIDLTPKADGLTPEADGPTPKARPTLAFMLAEDGYRHPT